MSVKSKSDKVVYLPYRFVFNASVKTRLKSIYTLHDVHKSFSGD
jgi:hypothetical protein